MDKGEDGRWTTCGRDNAIRHRLVQGRPLAEGRLLASGTKPLVRLKALRLQPAVLQSHDPVHVPGEFQVVGGDQRRHTLAAGQLI